MNDPLLDQVEEARPRSIRNDPVCPHCLKDPMVLMRKEIEFPDGVIVAIMFCAETECRKLISATPIGRRNLPPGVKLIRPS